ncbi:hypothetical protein D9M68_821640 [compost metagenome]
MRDQRDTLAGVAARQRQHGVDGALMETEQRFALRRRVVRHARLPAGKVFGQVLGHFGVGLALQRAVAAFAQARVGAYLQPQRLGQRRRGFHGPRQVAGIHRVDRLAGQRGGQRARLGAAGLVQRNIELALQPALPVPGRLAMADYDQVGKGQRLQPGALRHADSFGFLEAAYCASLGLSV